MIRYDSGREFFYDLIVCYGINEGIRIAKDYLDLPARNVNPLEMDFCRELYQTMITYEKQHKTGTSRPA